MEEQPTITESKTGNAKPKRRWLRNLIIGLAIFFAVYVGLIIWLFSSLSGHGALGGGGGGIALIRIEGPLAAAGSEGILSGGTVTPDSIIDQLKQAEDDDAVDAVLLRINSPGGTASAGQEIYLQVKELRKKKPVVVSIADVGASAAYLLASPADKIVAAPSSLVGSIGTIIEVPNYRGLYQKLGVDYTVIAQGKFKDMGDPNRPLTDEEKAILDRQSKEVYDQFIDDVAAGRRMPRQKVADLATGLAFLGSEGKKLGLVDKLGNFQNAIDLAAKLGKIKGEPEIIEYEQSSFLQTFSQILSSGKSQLKDEIIKELQSTLPPSTPIK